jgi:MoaA/NifB/PqqE/SkfB family radical SAM enzyme/GT2 family glycosyltransferase
VTKPGVSVVVPVYNGKGTLAACLASLELQDYDGPREVILVDNGSTDGSGELAIGRRFTRVVSCSRRGPAAARNDGVDAARYELVAFTDADCIPQPKWLGELVDALSPELAAVGGPLPAAVSGTVPDLVAEISFNQEETAAAEMPYLATANALFRRSALISVGGFDERFPIAGGEDSDLGWRLKFADMKIGYAPRAVCLHQHPQSVLDFVAQRFRYGYGAQLLCAKYADQESVRALYHPDWRSTWSGLCRSLRHLISESWRRPNLRQWLLVLDDLAFFTGLLCGALSGRRRFVDDDEPESLAIAPMCLKPWTSFELDDQNGNVLPCCWTRKVVGNVREDSLLGVWNGPGFQEFRRNMLAGDYKKMCPSDCPHRTGALKDTLPDAVGPPDYRRNIELLMQDIQAKRTRLRAKPIALRLQPSIRCNLECIMCWQRDETDAELPPAFYQDVDQLLPTLKSLLLQGGEPLLIKKCRRLIRASPPHPQLDVSMITNGTLLSDNFLELIKGVKVRWMLVSLDAACAETYEIIRGGDFARVCEGIRRVLHHRPDIEVIIGFVVMNENVGEVPAFIRLAEELNVDFEFSPLNPGFKKGNDFADLGFRNILSAAIEEGEAYMAQVGRRNSSLTTVKQRIRNEEAISSRRKRHPPPLPPRGSIRAVQLPQRSLQ